MDYGAIISAAVQLLSSQAGASAAALDKQKALELIKASVDEFGKINVPKLEQLFLKNAPDTQLSKITDDPAYRAQQSAADAQLNDVINSGGLTLGDRATLNAIRDEAAQRDSSNRAAITGQMASRGTLDSGAQLAMMLQGQQASAQNAARADESAAGQAQARMYQAIQQRAQNAGQGLDRSYRQQSDAARAQDAINQGNINIQNTAAKYNAGLPQQNFSNQLGLAGARAQPGYVLGGAYGAMAADKQNQANGLGKIGGQAAGAAANGIAEYAKSQNSGSDVGNYAASDPNEWGNPYSPTGYGNTNQGMTSESTKPQKTFLGYDDDGKPLYGRKA